MKKLLILSLGIILSSMYCVSAQSTYRLDLLYNRSDNQMFHSFIFPVADSIFFIKGRIRFFRPDGTRGEQPGAGSILIAFGKNNTEAIENSGLIGHIFKSVNKKVALQTSLIF